MSKTQHRRDENPTISVITIVYNNCNGFEQTARSVVDQVGTNWEWIVIDGASTDGTLDAIHRFAKNIDFWVSEPDGGIFAAMNKGLQQARGEFVVFMNSGDRFPAADTLKHVSETIANADPDIGMVLGGARFELSSTYSYVQTPRPLDPYVYHSLPTSHQAMYFRRELHLKALFANMRVAADYDAICRMFVLNPKAAYLNEVVADVWRGLDSNSVKHPLANMRDMAGTQARVLGLDPLRIFASGVRRAVPVLAFWLMSNRWTSRPTSMLISMLRPAPGQLQVETAKH